MPSKSEMRRLQVQVAEGVIERKDAEIARLTERAEQAERERNEARGECERLRTMLRESVRLCGKVAYELGCPDTWEAGLAAIAALRAKLEAAEARLAKLTPLLEAVREYIDADRAMEHDMVARPGSVKCHRRLVDARVALLTAARAAGIGGEDE